MLSSIDAVCVVCRVPRVVLEPLPRKKKPVAKKDAGGAKKAPAPKKAPVPTTSTTEQPSMSPSAGQAPAAEPKGPAPPPSTTADECKTKLGGDQVVDASVQAQPGEEEPAPPATTTTAASETEQVDTATATAMATKRGGKKKTGTKKERTLLPMSNNALQSRQQQVEVCKAIAREMFKHQTQNAAETDDDVYHRPTTQPTDEEAEAQPVPPSSGPTKGHLQEANLFMGDKEALDLLQAEGTSPSAWRANVISFSYAVFVCGKAQRNRRAEIGRAPPCWPCGRATWAPRFVRRFRRTYVGPTPA